LQRRTDEQLTGARNDMEDDRLVAPTSAFHYIYRQLPENSK